MIKRIVGLFCLILFNKNLICSDLELASKSKQTTGDLRLEVENLNDEMNQLKAMIKDLIKNEKNQGKKKFAEKLFEEAEQEVGDSKEKKEEKKSKVEKEKEEKDKKDKEKKDEKILYTFSSGKNNISFGVKNRTEGFYARSVQLLSPSPLDQIMYMQYTWDLKTEANIEDLIKMYLVLRHKSRWGNPNSIARTTIEDVKVAGALVGTHQHFFGKQVYWMREGWIDINLNRIFDAKHACTNHYLKLGCFPFQVGRGISLGDGFTVTPGLLGFYSSAIVDQYAIGLLLHGDLRKNKATYDLYVELAGNFSDSFQNVNQKVYDQIIGRRKTPQRGFGKFDNVYAARMNLNLLDPEKLKDQRLTVEPYFVYSQSPWDRVKVQYDANSKLYTLGVACEYTDPKWEYGFEFGQNFGRQQVLGVDFNVVKLENREGIAVFNYSDVTTVAPAKGTKPPRALVTKKNEKIVNSKIDKQCPDLNGKEIDNSGLFNSKHRFRPGYCNFYNGFMFVTDWTYKPRENLSFSAEIGMATGGDNPNANPVTKDYRGFIGLQEYYSGKRVTSLFITGPNALTRPTSVPSAELTSEEDIFSVNDSGFTNVVYFGFGAYMAHTKWNRKFIFKPNAIVYYLENPPAVFDPKIFKKSGGEKLGKLNDRASNYVGTELNTSLDIILHTNLKFFFVGGIFFPGAFFDDIEGVPLNKEQIQSITDQQNTGEKSPLPHVGKHIAATLNWGFEFTF